MSFDYQKEKIEIFCNMGNIILFSLFVLLKVYIIDTEGQQVLFSGTS